MRRAVITGIGALGAGFNGKEELFDMLMDKKVPLKPIPPEYETYYTYKTRYYIPPPELADHEKSMEDISKIVLECTKMAMDDANLTDLADSGVILGVGMSSLTTGFSSYIAHAKNEGRFNRFVIPMLMPNSPAAWIGLKYGADNFAYTINAACASGSIAIGEAYEKILSGKAKRVLTGGVDCLSDPTGAIMRGFDSIGTLTKYKDGLPRPFSKDRSGFLFNMGAGCVLMLEDLTAAKERDATIYAEITGYQAMTCAQSIVQMPTDYHQLLPLFNIADNVKVDYLNAHGTGTLQNDELESRLINHMWGDKQPVVNSTKSILGHSIGASGALETAVTAMSICTSKVHGTLTDNVEYNINCPTKSQALEIENALSVSYGFGGHNALLMLSRY